MKFLVDAHVLSEPTRQRPERQVIQWLQTNKTDCAINPIVLGEIQIGILALPTSNRRNVADYQVAGVKIVNPFEE